MLIFVDRTTSFDDIDKRIFADGFDRIMSRLRVGDRVFVQTIGGDYTKSETVFNQCLPGCPDEGLVNWLMGSCKSVIARGDLAQFRSNLAGDVRNLLEHPESYKHSDIARTVANLSRIHAARAQKNGQAPVGLVFLFSDLLENSTVVPWRMLAGRKAKAALEAIRREEQLPELHDAEVAAFGFGRSHDPKRSALSPPTARAVKDFWEAYFKQGGARDIYIGQYLN